MESIIRETVCRQVITNHRTFSYCKSVYLCGRLGKLIKYFLLILVSDGYGVTRSLIGISRLNGDVRPEFHGDGY